MSDDLEPQTNPANYASSSSMQIWLSCTILLACLLAGLTYSFPPLFWKIPDDMADINAMSPPADQAKLAVVVKANLWKNTMLKFTMAGLGIGLGMLTLVIMPSKFGIAKASPITPAVVLVGAIGGLLTGVIGLVVRQYLDLDNPIPFVSDSSRPLFCDSVVFSIISILLLLPISFALKLQSSEKLKQLGSTIPLGGLLTGLLVPFAGAMVLPMYASTSVYPPAGTELLVLWFTSLAVLTIAFCWFRPSKRPVASTSTELGAV